MRFDREQKMEFYRTYDGDGRTPVRGVRTCVILTIRSYFGFRRRPSCSKFLTAAAVEEPPDGALCGIYIL